MFTYKIVYPGDWQTVGSRPDVLVRTNDPESRLEVCVVGADDFRRNGAQRARDLARAAVVRHTDLMGGQVASPLPDGEYVICLRDPASGAVLGASGIHVDANVDRWGEYFTNMLDCRGVKPVHGQPTPGNAQQAAPLFSIITTVYDTDPLYLDELVRMVQGQTFRDFEWLVLDNGSRRAETVRAVEAAAQQDSRIRRFRVEQNIHIIGGNRYLLERAQGIYIVPIDSDDMLYTDALEIVARECRSADAADVYYSDEQKVTPLGVPVELIWRPGWSRLFATATCPAAHLMVYRRELGLAAGAYTAEYARGSHDWDTLLRLVDGGARPVRIQEVLYGWRMHPESSSLNEGSKDYLTSSQKEVLQQSLQRRGLDQLFRLDHAKGAMSYYHFVRNSMQPRPLAVDFVVRAPFAEQLGNLRHNLRRLAYPLKRVRILQCGVTDAGGFVDRLRSGAWTEEWIAVSDAKALAAAVSESPEGVYAKAIIDCSLRISDPGWAWDAIGTLELDADTGIVTGPIMSEDNLIATIGYFAGLDGFFGTPCPGRRLDAPYGAIGFLRRHVTAAHSGFMVIRGDVMKKCGGPLSVDGDDALGGIEFCLRCLDQGIRTAYTPRMPARRRAALVFPVGSSDESLKNIIVARYGERIATDPYYSRYLLADSNRFAEVNL